MEDYQNPCLSMQIKSSPGRDNLFFDEPMLDLALLMYFKVVIKKILSQGELS